MIKADPISIKYNKSNSPGTVIRKPGSAIFFPGMIQAKFTVNQPGDVYEQEADATAKEVVNIRDNEIGSPAFFKPVVTPLAKNESSSVDTETGIQGKDVEGYIGGLGGRGNPLPANTRSFYESRLGYDFSDVRIHTDESAAKSAQSIDALAYTSGNNIAFNKGQYSPGTGAGKQLLAHELTHVVQQTGKPSIQRKTHLEQEGITDATTVKSSKIKDIVLGALANTSSVLYPYINKKIPALTKKLSGISVDDPAVFGYKYKKINKITDPAMKDEDVHKTIGGFIDPKKKDIYLHLRSNYCSAFHEALHVVSSYQFISTFFGPDIMEGLTQYFTDILFKEQTGQACTTHSYIPEVKCANKVVTLLGFDMVARMFFNGESNLLDEVVKKFGIKKHDDIEAHIKKICK